MKSKELSFYKYTGCGNDFIIIDDRTCSFPIANSAFIQKICHRHQGVGADGVILLQPSRKAKFRMRILNSDGSEAEMCGNGIRCLARFIEYQGLAAEHFYIETLHKLIGITIAGDQVSVDMGTPYDIQWNVAVSFAQSTLNLHLLNTGVPHAILFVDQIHALDTHSLGKSIRHHPMFHPRGVNVNFVCLDQQGKVWNRTYERGVEAETMACGTGSTAAALAAAKIYSLQSPIEVKNLSGDTLQISFEFDGDQFHQVKMSGPAQLVYKGLLPICDF